MRMRRTVRTAWIEALRSGNYSQAKGGLHVLAPDGQTAIGHCCLGVACELAKAAGVPVDKGQAKGDVASNGNALYVPFDGEYSYPPASVGEWMGFDGASDTWGVRLPGDDPENPDGVDHVDLAETNDQGASFDWIADALENDLDADDDIRDDLAAVTP